MKMKIRGKVLWFVRKKVKNILNYLKLCMETQVGLENNLKKAKFIIIFMRRRNSWEPRNYWQTSHSSLLSTVTDLLSIVTDWPQWHHWQGHIPYILEWFCTEQWQLQLQYLHLFIFIFEDWIWNKYRLL